MKLQGEKNTGKTPASRTSSSKKRTRDLRSPRTSSGKNKQDSQPSVVSREEARKNYKFLGEGITGEVFLSKAGTALKYEKSFSEESLLAKGYDSKTVKKLRQDFDENYESALKSEKMMGDLGISPKILGTSEVGEDRVMEMEYLKGYKDGFPDDKEIKRSFLKNLKIAHQNNIVVADLHEDNLMSNSKTKEVKFVDQGGAKKSSQVEIADQLLNPFGWRPLAANTIENYIEASKDKKLRSRFKKVSRTYKRNMDSLSEKEAQKLIEETYSILGELI